MSFLDFLNKNSGAFTVFFTLVVAAATVFYAILTRQLVKETARMREAQTEPSVGVRVEPHDAALNFVMLVIENVGPGAAYDVHLTSIPDFVMERGQHLSDLGFFKHGFKYLGPGQRMKTFLTGIAGKGDEIAKPDGPYRFDVLVKYRSALGTEYQTTYPIDLVHLLGMSTLGRPPLIEMADNLKKLSESIAHIESGWRRLKVDLFTSRDRDREALDWEERRAEQIAAQRNATPRLSGAADIEETRVVSPPTQPKQSEADASQSDAT